MNEINCRIIQDLLPLYIDGACSEDSNALIEAHLTHCDDCRKHMILLSEDSEKPVTI